MSSFKSLFNCDEAQHVIEKTENIITRRMLNMAYVEFVKSIYFESRVHPSSDVDMAYVMMVLRKFLSDHDVLARTLAGEEVGEWFDE